MRLHKYLAQQGVASRRAAERFIQQGRVQVNGVVITQLGTQVEPTDSVKVDGQIIKPVKDHVYLVLNKPGGVITTALDTHNRPTVLQLVPERWRQYRVFPVGRLDLDTEGLLLLTNDGDFAYKLTHPRFHVPKTYLALIKGQIDEAKIERLRTGITLDDGPTQPAKVRVVEAKSDESLIQLIITEGRKRQIKRMCAAVGHPVLKLVRIKFGHLTLQGLPLGEIRELTSTEVNELEDLATGGGRV